MGPYPLAKATILNTVTHELITVMYNPEEYKLDQGNTFAEIGIPGLDAPPMQYVRGKAAHPERWSCSSTPTRGGRRARAHQRS